MIQSQAVNEMSMSEIVITEEIMEMGRQIWTITEMNENNIFQRISLDPVH
jgi:hypothetical protein